jgi:hypothetical protein
MDRLGNQVHPMIQTLFTNNNAVFQDDSAIIRTAGTVQSWFEEHEGELQHFPWVPQSPDLNITEPLWSVLEMRVWCRFPPPTSVEQLDRFGKNAIKFHYRLFKTCPVQEGLLLYGRQKRSPNSILIKKCVQHL